MIKNIVSFLFGAALASAWWATTLFHDQKALSAFDVIRVFLTLAAIFIFVMICIKHWND